jgi:asparagine synthase (glutamine-hydrolysing)
MNRIQQFLRVLKKAIDLPSSQKEYYILVSGGIDSSIVAALAKGRSSDVELYTIQAKKARVEETHTSPDFNSAKTLADHLDLNLHTISFTRDTLRVELPQIVSILKEVAFPGGIKPLDVLIAIPLYFGCQYFSKNGVTHFFTGGGGPDEILGGYKRHEDILLTEGEERVEQLIAHDIDFTIPRNLMRDSAITNFFNINLHLPYLDLHVKSFLEELPLNLKITEEDGRVIRKKFLRNVGRHMGLPQEIVDRPKKAFQYGSNTHRLLGRKELQNFLESFPPDNNSKS